MEKGKYIQAKIYFTEEVLFQAQEQERGQSTMKTEI